MAGFDDLFGVDDFMIDEEDVQQVTDGGNETGSWDTGNNPDIYATGERPDIFNTK